MNSKLNRDWIIFFTAPHVEKIRRGYNIIRKNNKKIQNGKTN